MKTVIGLYVNYTKAYDVARELLQNGFPRGDISVIAPNAADEYEGRLHDPSEEHVPDSTSGAEEPGKKQKGLSEDVGRGAAVGGLAGFALGLAAIVVPGIGPVLAAGPLATMLAAIGAGAATGGLVGALSDLGVPEENAEFYAEGLQRGGALVVVRSGEGRVALAEEIMCRHGPVDMAEQEGEGSGVGLYPSA